MVAELVPATADQKCDELREVPLMRYGHSFVNIIDTFGN